MKKFLLEVKAKKTERMPHLWQRVTTVLCLQMSIAMFEVICRVAHNQQDRQVHFSFSISFYTFFFFNVVQRVKLAFFCF